MLNKDYIQRYTSSQNIIEINNILCLLELGKWKIAEINSMLNEAQIICNNKNEKLIFIINAFVGTPFLFESQLPIPPKGVLRVRLESFDCITFIYTVIALCNSSSFEEFIKQLYLIRYIETPNTRKYLIDSCPDTGNILDFACESLVINAVKRGVLTNITNKVKGNAILKKVEINLKRFKRPPMHDTDELYVTPRFGERKVSEYFILSQDIDLVDKSKIKSGDVILITFGKKSKSGIEHKVLIGHLAIAYIENNEIYFYHSTRHFSWKPNANNNTKPSYTGIYYNNDPRKEQIGLALAGVFAGEEHATTIGSMTYFGLDQNIKRTLKDYVSHNFYGVSFFRLI